MKPLLVVYLVTHRAHSASAQLAAVAAAHITPLEPALLAALVGVAQGKVLAHQPAAQALADKGMQAELGYKNVALAVAALVR